MYVTYDERNAIFADWTTCLFNQFYNGYTNQLDANNPDYDMLYGDAQLRDDYAHKICGDSSRSIIALYEILWFYFGIFGHPLIAGILFTKYKNFSNCFTTTCCSCKC